MDIVVITFEAVSILLGIGIIGFWIMRFNIVPTTLLKSLNPLALDIALPSLIFVDILADFEPAVYPNWWQFPLWWILFTLFAGICTFIFRYISKKETRNEFAISLFYQNGIFFPLAILAGMFPNEPHYTVSLFLFIFLFPAFFFTTYPLFFHRSPKASVTFSIKKIIHPTLIATLIGIVISIFSLKQFVPLIATSVLSLLGGMTIPLLMIILGGNIYINYKKNGLSNRGETLKFLIIKNFIFPLCFIGFLLIFSVYIPKTIAFIMFLQSAVPPVTAVPMVTERMNGNHELTSQFTMISFIFSLVSLPVMIYIYQLFFSIQ